MKNLIKSPIACFSIFTLSSALASAAGILIDLGHDTQTTTGNWNNFTAATGGNPATLTDMIDSDGNTTTVDLSFAESFATAAGIAGPGANWDGTYPATVSALPGSALRDGMFVQQSGTATLTFSDLNPALTYNWTFYGARGNNGGGTKYELTGANSGTATISNIFENSNEVATLAGISPTVGGVITLKVTQVTGTDQASLNFIQVDAIPEPSVIGLAGLGLLGILRRRR